VSAQQRAWKPKPRLSLLEVLGWQCTRPRKSLTSGSVLPAAVKNPPLSPSSLACREPTVQPDDDQIISES
jgi:hypothetical protein